MIARALNFPLLHRILMGVVGALGLFVMSGWWGGSAAITQVHPSFVPMQFNTALCFFLLGVAGVFRGVFQYLVPVVFFLVSVTGIQYVFGINVGLDELFVKHGIEVHTSSPGRMAPNTVLGFMLSCAAMWFRRRSGIFGAMAASVGLVALSGYLFDLPPTYGWGKMTYMAVHTSLLFVLLGNALMCDVRGLLRSTQYFGVTLVSVSLCMVPAWMVHIDNPAVLFITILISAFFSVYSAVMYVSSAAVSERVVEVESRLGELQSGSVRQRLRLLEDDV